MVNACARYYYRRIINQPSSFAKPNTQRKIELKIYSAMFPIHILVNVPQVMIPQLWDHRLWLGEKATTMGKNAIAE